MKYDRSGIGANPSRPPPCQTCLAVKGTDRSVNFNFNSDKSYWVPVSASNLNNSHDHSCLLEVCAIIHHVDGENRLPSSPSPAFRASGHHSEIGCADAEGDCVWCGWDSVVSQFFISESEPIIFIIVKSLSGSAGPWLYQIVACIYSAWMLSWHAIPGTTRDPSGNSNSHSWPYPNRYWSIFSLPQHQMFIEMRWV